jgi:PBSX family phage portal protein
MPDKPETGARPQGHDLRLRTVNPDGPLVRKFKEYAQSRAIDDPFKSAYGVGQGSWHALHEPPYSFYALMRMPQDNSTLNQCIEAMVTNVDGHGYRLEYIADEEDELDQEGKAVKGEAGPAAQAEKKVLEDLLNYPNDDYTLQELRDRVRRDYEVLGNAYIEVGRDALGRVVMLSHLPAHTIRLTNREVNPIEVEITLPREGGKEMKRKVQKRFRRFVQMVGNRRVYFKEYGDPRNIDPATGEEMQQKGKAALSSSATEVMHLASYNPSSPYGLPRWFNQMRNILGQSQAETVNLDFFRDNAIPAMMLLVAGGAVTQSSIDTLTDHFNASRGRDSMQRVMIIEATGDQAAADNEGKIPPPKVELKPLVHERQTDANFLEYDKNVMDKIRSAFRVPPLFLGRSEDHTRATAKSSYEVAESQVFGPERQRFDDMINRKVLATYQPKFWSFRSNPPRLSDQDALIAALTTFDTAGALSPNVSIGIANEMFDLEIPPVEEDWGNYPMALVVQMLTAGKLKIDLQNTAPVDPNAPTHFDENGNPIDPFELQNQQDGQNGAPGKGPPGKGPPGKGPTPTDTKGKPKPGNDNSGGKQPPKRLSKSDRAKLLTEETTRAMTALHERLRAIREE